MGDSNQKRPTPPGSYHFVTDPEPGQPSQIRPHFARERWRQRKASGLEGFQRTKPRRLASAPTLSASASSPFDFDTASSLSKGNYSREVFINLGHSLQKGPMKWIVSRILKSSQPSPSPYQSPGYAEFELFNGLRLSLDDQNFFITARPQHVRGWKLD
jgi:hypothetical protein